MKTFHFVDAPAASGKTRALVAHAADRAQRGFKIVIAQPSVALLKQTRRDLRAADPALRVTGIYTEDDRPNAVARITHHLEAAAPQNGEVLLITHQALARLESQGFRSAWELYVDEIPSVFSHQKLVIKYTHGIVTDHLKLNPLIPGISVVEAASPQQIDDLIARAGDDQNIATFQDLLKAVRDPNRMVCVQDDTWSTLLAGDAKRADFFTLVLPEKYAGWREVTFLGANATDTEMMLLWQHLPLAKFVSHTELSKALAYTTHGNGHRLTLHYLFDRWSKEYAASSVDEEATVLRAVGDTISDFFSGPYIWQANKGNEQLLDPRGFIPHLPHGLNRPDMMGCHNVALLAALNRETAATRFLIDLGVDESRITATLAYQSEYQTAMRCSLRDPNAIAPVHIVVPTKGSAEWIAERFPGCRIQHLDTGLAGPKRTGRKPIGAKPLTPAERKARMKAKKAASL